VGNSDLTKMSKRAEGSGSWIYEVSFCNLLINRMDACTLLS